MMPQLPANLDYTQIGFWGMFTLFMVKDVVAPSIKTYIPQLFKRTNREQDRLDKEQEFKQQMELRTVEALEAIKENTALTKEFMILVNGRLEMLQAEKNIQSRKKSA